MKTTLRPLILALSLAATSASVLAGVYDDLIAAVYRDDTAAVLDLVNRGMDVNSVDPAGNTLLHVASRNGNDALIAALLKQKGNPNARNRLGETPLVLAAYSGKMAAAEALLAGGAQLNTDGWSALQYAVFAEQAEMVKYLLGKGAKVDARAPNQQTALMLAAKNGNAAIAQLLLKANADPELKDQNGDTALVLARNSGNTEVARLLEQAPPVAKPQSESQPAPLETAAAPAQPQENQRSESVPPQPAAEK
ncbi:MAG: ankyrin repeat domain-containing protein [Rhodocyclaceae bacterium]|nr:ankyrin repeat domain-containing protein [Rhodocyclaceae bacterium]